MKPKYNSMGQLIPDPGKKSGAESAVLALLGVVLVGGLAIFVADLLFPRKKRNR